MISLILDRFGVMSLQVGAPFVKNFSFFCIGFSPEPRYGVPRGKNAVPVVVNSEMTKVTRVEAFFHRLGSFFRSPHHVILIMIAVGDLSGRGLNR